MLCSNCGTENPTDAKFCGGCGTALVLACPACGTANDPGMRFCTECGTVLADGAAAGPVVAPVPAAAVPPAPPTAERRIVSVLFADLVGFTAASASRDSEETRDLL